MLTQSDPDSK